MPEPIQYIYKAPNGVVLPPSERQFTPEELEANGYTLVRIVGGEDGDGGPVTSASRYQNLGNGVVFDRLEGTYYIDEEVPDPTYNPEFDPNFDPARAPAPPTITQRRQITSAEASAILNPPTPQTPRTYAPQRTSYVDPRTGELVIVDLLSGQEVGRTPGAGIPESRQSQAIQYVEPSTGDLVLLDPNTFQEIGRVPGAGVPQETPEQRAAREEANREDEQAFAAEQAQAARAATAQANAASLAARASEFAASHGLNERRFAFEMAEASRQAARQNRLDRLAAAETFAQTLETTDPAAFRGFVRLGGGVISNALATGADALSNAAAAPAAEALTVAEGLGGNLGPGVPTAGTAIDRVLAYRRNAPAFTLGSSEFDPRFYTDLSSEGRAAFARNRQLRAGVPASETLNEAERFRLQGTAPRSFSFAG